METVYIIRCDKSNHGTFGYLIVDGDLFCRTGEPPWRDNKPNLSCVPQCLPPGSYDVVWHHSPHFGWCYHVTNVKGRGHILMHPGNYCGDKLQGLKTNTLGCILLGKSVGFLSGQKSVLCSRPTVRRFHKKMNQEDFKLTII